MNNFQARVCSLFKKKIVSGKVCFEADLNQYKKSVNWENSIKKGFSFIVDTNDEYDVRNLLENKGESQDKPSNYWETLYSESDTQPDQTISILLKTISKYNPLN